MGVSLPCRSGVYPVNQVVDDFLREYRLHRAEKTVGREAGGWSLIEAGRTFIGSREGK